MSSRDLTYRIGFESDTQGIDDAVDAVEALSNLSDGIEPIDVPVEIDTDPVTELQTLLDELSDGGTVDVEVETGPAQARFEALLAEIDELDGSTAVVHAETDGFDDVAQDLADTADEVDGVSEASGAAGDAVARLATSLGLGGQEMQTASRAAGQLGQQLGLSSVGAGALSVAAVGIGAAIAAAGAAWDAFNAKSDRTAEVTGQVSDAFTELFGQLDRVQSELNEIAAASGNFEDQFSAALRRGLDEGDVERTTKALFDLGLTWQELGATLIAIENDTESSVTGMAEILRNAGVTEYTDEIARAVHAGEDMVEIQLALEGQLAASGVSMDAVGVEARRLVDAYESQILAAEELNDQQQNADYQQVIERQIALTRATDEATDAYLRQWEAANPDASPAETLAELTRYQEEYRRSVEGTADAWVDWMVAQENPLEVHAALISQINRHIADGTLATDDGAAAMNRLRDALPTLDDAQIFDLIAQGLTEDERAAATAAEKIAEVGKAIEAMRGVLGTGVLAAQQEELRRSVEGTADAYQEWLTARDPLAAFGDVVRTIGADIRDGTLDTEAGAAAMNRLRDAYPDRSDADLFAMVTAELDSQAAAADEAARAADAYAVALAGAQQQLADLAAGRGAALADELRRQLSLEGSELDVAQRINAIRTGITGLAEFAKDNPITVIPENLDSGPLLTQFASLRGPIQEELVAIFEEGGTESAVRFGAQMVAEIYQALDGKVSPEEIARLLGIDDIEAVIAVSINEQALKQAQQTLRILTGLEGQTPYTASIELALAAGDITPQAAQLLINAALQGAGVEVPAGLRVDPELRDAALDDAQRWADANGVTLQLVVDPTTGETTIAGFIDQDHTVTIGAEADTTDAATDLDDVAEDRTANITPNVLQALVMEAILNAVARDRTATITAEAKIADAETALAAVTERRRVIVDVVLGNVPTAAEIRARIGNVNIPVDAYARHVPRFDGNRP